MNRVSHIHGLLPCHRSYRCSFCCCIYCCFHSLSFIRHFHFAIHCNLRAFFFATNFPFPIWYVALLLPFRFTLYNLQSLLQIKCLIFYFVYAERFTKIIRNWFSVSIFRRHVFVGLINVLSLFNHVWPSLTWAGVLFQYFWPLAWKICKIDCINFELYFKITSDTYNILLYIFKTPNISTVYLSLTHPREWLYAGQMDMIAIAITGICCGIG